jgi:hypothetical protein
MDGRHNALEVGQDLLQEVHAQILQRQGLPLQLDGLALGFQLLDLHGERLHALAAGRGVCPEIDREE